jgi:MoaA/NifB/PqqE/SkfB family radical SAM enzyme
VINLPVSWLGIETRLWPKDSDAGGVFSREGVELATAWYSDDPGEHAQITGRPTFDQTKANIVEALRRSIPLFVGMTEVLDGQRIEQAKKLLVGLGVDPSRINVDRTRRLGRASGGAEPDISELCGRCGQGRAAVLADGSMTPCPLAHWMVAGDVRVEPIHELLRSTQESAAAIREAVGDGACVSCGPNDGGPCEPNSRH